MHDTSDNNNALRGSFWDIAVKRHDPDARDASSAAMEEEPVWYCDRCCALQSQRYLRAWYARDAQVRLCHECTLAIVLMWFDEHKEEIKAKRKIAREAP